MKKIRWRKLKSRVKNFLLVIITVVAFIMLMDSSDALLDKNAIALVVFVISLAWLVLFGHANDWLKESA